MDFKTCNETLIAYRHQQGSGPVVVCAHALGCDQSIWDNALQALGPTQARLTYDLRGHGASGRDCGPDGLTIQTLGADLIALLEALGLQQVILCGVSIGGMVAQHVAAVRPDLLRGLVLCNTAPRIGTVERWEARIAAVRAQGLAALADDILAQWFPPAFKNAAPEAWAGHKAMLQRNDPDAYVQACAALRDADLTAATAGIIVPTTCVSGSADGSVTTAQVADLAGRIAGARHVTLEGVGHLPCLDAPADVAQVIRDMIDRTAPAQTRQEAGMAVRRAVLGDAHVDRAEGARTAFDDAFQTLITEGAWGTVWASDAISLRERSMLTLALLAALGNFDEIPMHVRATVRTGAGESDLREVFQHVAIYAGVPRANHALKLAKQTLAEMRESGDG